MKIRFEKERIKRKVPIISSIILILISNVLPIPAGTSFSLPFIPILCIVGWTLLLRNLFGVLTVFSIGLISDFIIGTPLGSYSLIFILVYILLNYLILKFRSKNFFFSYLISTLAILFFYIFQTLFILFYFKLLLDFKYFFYSLMLTISLFPAIYIFQVWIYNLFKLKLLFHEAS